MHLEMKNIVMDFGSVLAVNNVSIEVKAGQIVGLLGENGAGKSTLMNVLAGVYSPTSGNIFIDEKEIVMKTIKTADENGIRFIHQELNLCNDLRVFENMFLANEKCKGPLLDRKEMIKECKAVFERMKIDINPTAVVGTLTAAEKQLIEIGKALLFKSELIIMDEPSTALSNNEIDNLFALMRQLKEEGVSFIYISHKMPELFEICDIYYVMRDGELIGHGLFKDINEEQITEMMVGHNIEDSEFSNHQYHGTDEVVLSLKDVYGNGVNGVSFDLHAGEIIAITGLQGSGREELVDILCGYESHTGEIRMGDNILPKKAGVGTVRKYMKAGVSLVPRMRKERGIHNDLSVIDNLSMGYINTRLKTPFVSTREEKERFERQKEKLSIKVASPKALITSLSGGNQQKVILGKWIEVDSPVILFDNPTQGIDVGAKFEIYHLILQLAREGKAILVFTAEFPELYKVADTCKVMYHGKVNADLNREEMSEKKVMYYSTGSNLEEK